MRCLRLPGLTSVLLLAGLSACSETVRPLFVAEVGLEPDSMFLRPGEMGAVRAVPRDSRGEPLPDRIPFVRWSVDDPGVTLTDSLGESVDVTALSVGTAVVRAALGRGQAESLVFVVPAGELQLAIHPSPLVLDVGEGLDLTAVLLDGSGEVVDPEGHRVSWAFDNDEVALLSADQSTSARLFGRSPGTGRLTLVVSDQKVTATVTVR